MKAEVWYHPNPLTRLELGKPGTPVPAEQYEFIVGLPVDVTPDAKDQLDMAERIWRDMNVVDGTELPMQLKVRSMDMGDVVVFHDEDGPPHAYVARLMGFERVTFDKESIKQ